MPSRIFLLGVWGRGPDAVICFTNLVEENCVFWKSSRIFLQTFGISPETLDQEVEDLPIDFERVGWLLRVLGQ